MPLIDLVYHGGPVWENFLSGLGAPTDCRVAFERRVPSPKPRGNPSQTDAVIASASTLWAIEAKWTEPVDRRTVARHITKPESDGGDPRLTVAGWLRHLAKYLQRPLEVDEFSDAIYQMVHRAASAAYLAMEQKCEPQLVYLHFVPPPAGASASTDHYVSELTRLKQCLGSPEMFPIRVVEITLLFTEEFEAIRYLDKHSPATAAQVIQALCAGPLFTFGEPKVFPI